MITKWQKYKRHGQRNLIHWTKSTTISYCEKCDKTFRTIALSKSHRKQYNHRIFSKRFYRGQRFRDIRGVRNGQAKLSTIEVKLLKILFNNNISTYVLGLYFGISQAAAYCAATGKTWKNISTEGQL